MRYVILTDEEAKFLGEALMYQVTYVTEMSDSEKHTASDILRKLATRS